MSDQRFCQHLSTIFFTETWPIFVRKKITYRRLKLLDLFPQFALLLLQKMGIITLELPYLSGLSCAPQGITGTHLFAFDSSEGSVRTSSVRKVDILMVCNALIAKLMKYLFQQFIPLLIIQIIRENNRLHLQNRINAESYWVLLLDIFLRNWKYCSIILDRNQSSIWSTKCEMIKLTSGRGVCHVKPQKVYGV